VVARHENWRLREVVAFSKKDVFARFCRLLNETSKRRNARDSFGVSEKTLRRQAS